jgi:hypothetical protein
MSNLFDTEQYEGTPTLEHIFEGPTDKQVADYIRSLGVIPEELGSGRSSIDSHPDTVYLEYLEYKYASETNNPSFSIRAEIDKHMKESKHGKKTRNTASRLLQNTQK